MKKAIKKTITIKVNSIGGCPSEALAIVGRIYSCKCPITTELHGVAYSAASLIFASGHKRRVSRFAWFMHHESQYTAEGGTTDHKMQLEQVVREEKMWARAMEEFSLKDYKFWYNKRKEHYFDAKQLKDYGVADEIF